MVLAAALSVPISAQAADDFIYRVGGEVTAKNFDGLATFMMNSVDQFVGLKLVVSAENKDPDGVFAEESGGLLSIYKRKSDVSLAFTSGYHREGTNYYFDGYYRVKYAGLHQGINALSLSPARTMDVEGSGKPGKDLDIGKLKPGTKD